MDDEPQIPKFYANKKILITGATGFIGKVLLWKLLDSCPQIDTIYVLIRPKYGKSTSSRKDELFNFMIFDILKKKNSKILEKVVLIPGDVGEENLALTDTDKAKIIDVSIVFHGAAMLKMDADLKKAVNVNTEGTHRILKLCLEMKHLQTFVYISTAYCCCDERIIEEKIYTVKEVPRDIIQLVRWMEPDMLEMITSGLLKQLPNTYTYTKRLAEGLLQEYSSEFPIIVARPTIVIPCLKEPLPGWVDNLNGPLGLSIAVAKGVMRVVNCNPDKTADMIPADIVANGLIAAAWASCKFEKSNQIQVYHLALTETEPITWREIHDRGITSCQKYPFERMLWYPATNCFYQNKTVFWFLSILLHWVPAYLIDFIMMILGQKTFMIRVQNKIFQGQKVLFYFARREWTFQTDGIFRLKKIMSESDKQIFPITMRNLSDRQKYVDNVIYIARKVLMKDDPRSIPECRKKLKRMYYMHCIVRTILFLLVIKFSIQIFTTLVEIIAVT